MTLLRRFEAAMAVVMTVGTLGISNSATGAAAQATACPAAAAIQHADVSSTCGSRLNGSRAQAGSVLRLTPAALDQRATAFALSRTGDAGNTVRGSSATTLSFASPVEYSTGSVPRHAVLGDVSGDHRPDIITPNGGSDTLSTLLNAGTGTFAKPVLLSPAGVATQDVALGDFDGDGKTDAAVVSGSNTVSVMRGAGTGLFGSATLAGTLASGEVASIVRVADVNGDGKPDIIVGATQTNACYTNGDSETDVLLGNGDGTFQAPAEYPSKDCGNGFANLGSTVTGLATADLNGDGQPDIVIASHSTDTGCDCGRVYALMNSGSGAFDSPTLVGSIPGMSEDGEGVAVGDVNGDGIPDIVAAADPICCPNNTRGVEIILGGPSGFGAASYIADPALTNGSSTTGDVTGVAVADLDGNGAQDIVTSDSSSYSGSAGISVYKGICGGIPGSPGFVPTPGFSAQGITLGDVNGDHKPDAVIVNGSGVGVLVNPYGAASRCPPIGSGSVPGPWDHAGGGSPSEICLRCMIKHLLFGAPVDAESGNFWHTFTDFSISGRGYPLNFTHTYNSQAASVDGPLGYGWVINHGMFLSQDASTHAVTVHEEAGSQITFTPSGGEYSAPSRVIATLVKNGDGTFTFVRAARDTFVFNAAGQLIEQRDLNGYTTTFGYTAGQLTTVTDAAGRSLTLAYSGSHLVSVTDPLRDAAFPNGRQVRFAYDDGQGNLTDVYDVNNGHTHFTYDPGHLLLTMTDPRGTVVQNTYDAANRVQTQTVDPGTVPAHLNRVTSFTYAVDGNAQTSTITDPKGNVTVEQFLNGELVSLTKGYGTPQAATWSYSYDPVTLGMTTITDPNGHVTTRTYDASGNVLTSTDALNRETVTTYNGLNEPLAITDPNGVTTTMTYDANGNLLSTSRSLLGTSPLQSRVTSLQYDDAAHPGDVTSMTDPDGHPWTYAYDQYGDRTSVTDPLGNQASYAFNAIGWMTSATSPRGNVPPTNPAVYTTTFAHDAFGDVTTTTDPLGHQAVQQYDANGNLDMNTDADHNTTQYTYDAANELILTTRADGTTVRTDYNPDGSVWHQYDGKGNAATYTYDPLGRVSSMADPLQRSTSYTYDGAGNLRSVTDPQGQVTTYGYDAADERTSITYSDGRTPNVSNIQYDADGQRIQMTDGTGTSHWTYDSLNRLTGSTDGSGATVGYGYDLKGQLTRITYPLNLSVTRVYDAAGRVQQITDWLNNTTRFGYDPNSNMTTEILPDPTGVRETYSYDAADRLMAISDTKSGAPFAVFTYGRDNANQINAEKTTGSVSADETYSYTRLNQLAEDNGRGYSYDAAGNITRIPPAVGAPSATTFVYDAANEVTRRTRGSATNLFVYDKRGNRIVTTSGSVSSVTNYRYDQANRLTAYRTIATYGYNGDGLRMRKTVRGAAEPFVWDLAEGLPQVLKDGGTSYVYGASGLPLEQVSATGGVLYYHHDQLGSTRALTDASGGVVASYSYDAYGNLRKLVAGGVINPFQYAGQYRDAESGLYYLRARYYDPTTAQFISRDTLTVVTRIAYGYADDDPINLTDPAGECPWCVVIVGAVIVSLLAVEAAAPGCSRSDSVCINKELHREPGPPAENTDPPPPDMLPAGTRACRNSRCWVKDRRSCEWVEEPAPQGPTIGPAPGDSHFNKWNYLPPQ